MTQLELTQAMAEERGITIAEAKNTIDALFAIIVHSLKMGDFVYTPIGSFNVKQIEARNGTNPRTKAPIHIRARNKVKFTEFQNLRDAVN